MGDRLSGCCCPLDGPEVSSAEEPHSRRWGSPPRALLGSGATPWRWPLHAPFLCPVPCQGRRGSHGLWLPAGLGPWEALAGQGDERLGCFSLACPAQACGCGNGCAPSSPPVTAPAVTPSPITCPLSLPCSLGGPRSGFLKAHTQVTGLSRNAFKNRTAEAAFVSCQDPA